jgi:hypothetical protein
MLLMGMLVSQVSEPPEPEPFSFKDDKLGMNLEDFKARRRNPGQWENKLTRTVGSKDSASSSPGKGWEWVSDMKCKESVKAVTECDYTDTITNIPSRVTAIFADGKLAAIHLLYWDARDVLVAGTHVSAGDRTWQALIAKLGPAKVARIRADFPITGNTRRILRWDNGVSAVEFQNDPCNNSLSYPGRDPAPFGQDPYPTGWPIPFRQLIDKCDHCGLLCGG